MSVIKERFTLYWVYFRQFDGKSLNSLFMHIIILLKLKIRKELRLLALQSIENERFYVSELTFCGTSGLTSPLETFNIKTALIISAHLSLQ